MFIHHGHNWKALFLFPSYHFTPLMITLPKFNSSPLKFMMVGRRSFPVRVLYIFRGQTVKLPGVYRDKMMMGKINHTMTSKASRLGQGGGQSSRHVVARQIITLDGLPSLLCHVLEQGAIFGNEKSRRWWETLERGGGGVYLSNEKGPLVGWVT